MWGEDSVLFGGSAESTKFLGYLVQLLNYLIVMKDFLLQLKLPLEIGNNNFFQRFLLSLYMWLQISVQSMLLRPFFVHFMLEFMSVLTPVLFLSSLFHVVVENDEISTQIIRHLNSLKGGRVTFIPLNRVKAPHVNYPQSSDVIPLLKKLKFSPNYTPAFGQVSFYLWFCFQ